MQYVDKTDCLLYQKSISNSLRDLGGKVDSVLDMQIKTMEKIGGVSERVARIEGQRAESKAKTALVAKVVSIVVAAVSALGGGVAWLVGVL